MIQRKICMLGAFGVGKTSLVARYVHSMFSAKYQTTLGVKIDKKQLLLDGQEQTLVLWDIAGEDGVTQVRPSHLRGASGYLLVVDGCRAETLDTAISLQERATEAVGPVPFILVMNKADLVDTWQVSEDALKTLTERGWKLTRTSAKTGDGVEAMFHDLARAMLEVSDARAHAASSGDDAP